MLNQFENIMLGFYPQINNWIYQILSNYISTWDAAQAHGEYPNTLYFRHDFRVSRASCHLTSCGIILYFEAIAETTPAASPIATALPVTL